MATVSALALAAAVASIAPAHGQTVSSAGGQAAAQQPPTSPRPQNSASDAGTQESQTSREARSSPAAGTSAGAGAGSNSIVVTGTRASLQSAILRKKNAGTIVDSIVAEDVASFPDKNIGDALSRITGVQLTRDFGEGVQVSIRGVEPDLNRVEINGVGVPGSTYGGVATRGAEFRPLAAELVQSIDVYKGFTADMTEGGVGGTVSIETRQPLDLRRPLFAVTGQLERMSLSDKTQNRFNITASDRFFDGRLGVIVNLTRDKKTLRQDTLSDTQWQRIADFDGSPEKTVVSTDPRFAAVSSIAGCNAFTGTDRTTCQTQYFDYNGGLPARQRMLIRDTERTSFDGTVQYKVTNDLRVSYELTYNENRERLIDYNYTVDFTALNRFDLTRPIVTDANHNVIDWYGSPNVATANAGGNNIFQTGTRDFSQLGKNTLHIGRFDYNHGPLSVRGIASYSKGSTTNDTNQLLFGANIPGIHVKLDELGRPMFTFPAGYDPNDINTYTNVSVQYRPVEAEISEKMAKLDVKYALDQVPIFTRIWAGVQYRQNDAVQFGGGGRIDVDTGAVVPSGNITMNALLTPNGPFSPFGSPQADPLAPIFSGGVPSVNFTSNYNWSRAQLNEFLNATAGRTPGTFFGDYPGRQGWFPNGWLVPVFGPTGNYFDLSRFDHRYVREAVGSDGKVYKQIPAADTTEKIDAAYVRADYAFDLWRFPVNGNLGVRYVRTDVRAGGGLTVREIRVSNPTTGATTTVTVGSRLLPDFKTRYSDWLPAINGTVGLIPNRLVLRYGYAKMLARPQVSFLSPAITCTFDRTPAGQEDNINDLCSAGNPGLQPYRANEYDLNLAWYPNRDTLVSGGYFYKDVATFVVGPVLVPNVDLLGNGQLYTVSQRINGHGAKLSGMELTAQTVFTFLPAPFNGFGAQVNATFTDAKNVGLFNALNGAELPFPGLSRWSYNLIFFYDRGPINTRLAYNYRERYLAVVAERSGNPRYQEATGYLDGKFTYRFNPHLSAFVEAQNLTGEREAGNSGDPVRLADFGYSGRRYFAGVQFKY